MEWEPNIFRGFFFFTTIKGHNSCPNWHMTSLIKLYLYFVDGHIPYIYNKMWSFKLKLFRLSKVKTDTKTSFSNSTCILIIVMYLINCKEAHLFKLKLLSGNHAFSIFSGLSLAITPVKTDPLSLSFKLNLYFNNGYTPHEFKRNPFI